MWRFTKNSRIRDCSPVTTLQDLCVLFVIGGVDPNHIPEPARAVYDTVAGIDVDKLTWTHVSELNYWSNSAISLYGISSIPSNLLLDPEGKIIAKNLRGEDLHAELRKHLSP